MGLADVATKFNQILNKEQMTKLALEDSLINYKRGHLSLEAILVIVENYSSASNNGKPRVSGTLCHCKLSLREDNKCDKCGYGYGGVPHNYR